MNQCLRFPRLACLACVLLLFLAVVGCSAFIDPTATPEPPTPLPSATPTLTATATLTATLTPSPTATATSTPMPTATPVPLHVSVRIAPQVIEQGRTARIDVVSSHPAEVLWRMGDAEGAFGSGDGLRHIGYVGVSPVADEGAQALTVLARSERGHEITLETALQISAGDYGFEHIVFGEATEKLLAPEVTQPERERLDSVYGGESADHLLCSGLLDWPWRGTITSYFGTRRQYGDAFRSFHAGIDIDGQDGDPIAAPAAGTVVLAEELQVRGGAVIIDHGLGVMSGYYHLSRIDVEVGDSLVRGDVLGLMGATGLVTGSHLHWELRVGNVPVSPIEWVERDLTAPPEERL